MKAVIIDSDVDGSAHLAICSVEDPVPSARQVLVRVHAAGMNRADLSMKLGHFRAMASSSAPRVAGMEMAGEVVGCGSDVREFRAGDRVMAMCSGAHAELVCVDERLLIPIPHGITFLQAATLPAALMTAHDALVTHGGFKSGHHVLIQAASSAVGLAASQLALALGAATVIGTTSSPDKHQRLLDLGLTYVCDDKSELESRVKEITGAHGVDVIVDHLGGSALGANMACAAIGARIVSVGRMAGLSGVVDLDLLSLKRLSLIGVTFRTRTEDDVANLIASMRADVEPLLIAGRITMPLDRVFQLDEVAAAHTRMRAMQQFGKVVLVP